MSSIIIFSRSVDFPIPVFPIIYTCLLLSLGHIPKLIFVPRKFVFQRGVLTVSGSILSVRSGSIIGKFEGGSNARAATQLL
jgi:hypothetical protein